MTTNDFCYYLLGFFELSSPTSLNPNQLAMIREKLNSVFRKDNPTLMDIKQYDKYKDQAEYHQDLHNMCVSGLNMDALKRKLNEEKARI
jgi:hypothetical protein